MLSSGLVKKKATAHGKGLSSDSADAVATTFPDCNTSGLTGQTRKVRYYLTVTAMCPKSRLTSKSS